MRLNNGPSERVKSTNALRRAAVDYAANADAASFIGELEVELKL